MTATIAKKQNKKIFCLPCNINNKNARTNELIRSGAILVTSTDNILKELKIKKETTNISRHKTKEIIKVNPKYQQIYNQLSYTPININEICKKTNIEISKINGILMMLELEGHIKQLPGKMFKIV